MIAGPGHMQGRTIPIGVKDQAGHIKINLGGRRKAIKGNRAEHAGIIKGKNIMFFMIKCLIAIIGTQERKQRAFLSVIIMIGTRKEKADVQGCVLDIVGLPCGICIK